MNLTPESTYQIIEDFQTNPKDTFSDLEQRINRSTMEEATKALGEMKDIKNTIISEILINAYTQGISEVLTVQDSNDWTFREAYTTYLLANNGNYYPSDEIKSNDGAKANAFRLFTEINTHEEIQKTNPEVLQYLAYIIDTIIQNRSQISTSTIMNRLDNYRFSDTYILEHIIDPSDFASYTVNSLLNLIQEIQNHNIESSIQTTWNSQSTIARMASQNLHWGVDPLRKGGIERLENSNKMSFNTDYFDYDQPNDKIILKKDEHSQILYQEAKKQYQNKLSQNPTGG